MSECEFSPENDGEGEDTQQHCTDAQPQATKGTGSDNHDSSQEPRRGQRVRKLTEKGQELHDEQVRKIAHNFSVSYKKWKVIIKDANQVLSGQCSNNLLHEHIAKVIKASKDLNAVYEELRHIDIPDHDTRRRIDTCEAVTKTVIETARGRLNTRMNESQRDEEQGVKETESVFRSAASDKISIRSHHTKSSVHSRSSSKISSRHSSRRQ